MDTNPFEDAYDDGTNPFDDGANPFDDGASPSDDGANPFDDWAPFNEPDPVDSAPKDASADSAVWDTFGNADWMFDEPVQGAEPVPQSGPKVPQSGPAAGVDYGDMLFGSDPAASYGAEESEDEESEDEGDEDDAEESEAEEADASEAEEADAIPCFVIEANARETQAKDGAGLGPAFVASSCREARHRGRPYCEWNDENRKCEDVAREDVAREATLTCAELNAAPALEALAAPEKEALLTALCNDHTLPCKMVGRPISDADRRADFTPIRVCVERALGEADFPLCGHLEGSDDYQVAAGQRLVRSRTVRRTWVNSAPAYGHGKLKLDGVLGTGGLFQPAPEQCVSQFRLRKVAGRSGYRITRLVPCITRITGCEAALDASLRKTKHGFELFEGDCQGQKGCARRASVTENAALRALSAQVQGSGGHVLQVQQFSRADEAGVRMLVAAGSDASVHGGTKVAMQMEPWSATKLPRSSSLNALLSQKSQKWATLSTALRGSDEEHERAVFVQYKYTYMPSTGSDEPQVVMKHPQGTTFLFKIRKRPTKYGLRPAWDVYVRGPWAPADALVVSAALLRADRTLAR